MKILMDTSIKSKSLISILSRDILKYNKILKLFMKYSKTYKSYEYFAIFNNKFYSWPPRFF